VLVNGRKASRAPLELKPGLVLHGNGNRFLAEIEAILRDGAPLALARRG
jgi:tRNA1(Val) A37 N6-methylase TrmN6